MRDIIVIGSPIGGGALLTQLACRFPPDLDAAVFVVLHTTPENPMLLADLLNAPGRVRAAEAINGETIVRRRIYFAALGKHLVISDGHVHLTSSGAATKYRPSIDVLFSSAAEAYKSRVVAVLLLHAHEDGRVGLEAIRRAGGRAVTHRNELMPNEPKHPETGDRLGDDHLGLEQIPERVLAYAHERKGALIRSQQNDAAHAKLVTRFSSGMVGENFAAATEAALHEREITTAAMAKVAPVGIMRFDANGRCNYINDRWTEMSGLTIDEAIGDGWINAVHVEDRASVLFHWAEMQAADDLFREEYRLCRPDGSVRWVFAEGVPLRSYSGERLGFIRAVTDITRHRQLEAELTAARAELEERVRERTADLHAEMIERERLEKQVLEIKESEQRRFSQDLHDGLGQYLTGILFRALALQRSLATENAARADDAEKIAELVNEAINQAHDLARGIDPVPLRPDGLMWALDELVKKLCFSDGAGCRFECEEPVYIEDDAVASHLYRIAQEALTNAIKHSGATEVIVRLQKNADTCALAVQDDGCGFELKKTVRDNRGLNIIRHRARLIGAALNVQSRDDEGTLVECVVALPPRKTA